ncbi:MAG: class I SAM-dependent methyltransferase [Candidatus Limnocylindrales bacterium]
MTQEIETGTWHYGLMARWWAEFERPEPEELAFFGDAIRRYGEPALDLGCGTGRILLPLVAAGLDVDGTDISPDMIRLAADAANEAGVSPRLVVQAGQDLDLARRYRTIYLCDVFGLGGRRDWDREILHRAFRHLEPGGAVLIRHEFPYEGLDAERWGVWLPDGRASLPRPWPDQGDRKRTADGDEIELIGRLVAFDPYVQRRDLELRARLWRKGEVVAEETGALSENLYFAQEILLLLAEAGFRDVVVEAGSSRRPASQDDGVVVFIGRRPGDGAAKP